MRRFLKRLLYFFIPITVFAIVVELSVRQIPNPYRIKSNYLGTKASAIETLILGSSHTFYGLNPKFFKTKAFNAANVSQSPAIDYEILRTYFTQSKRLKYIVIRLSYDTLFERIKASSADWRLKDYNLYTSLKLDYKLYHNTELSATSLKKCLTKIKNYYLDNTLTLNCDSLGFGLIEQHKKDINLGKIGPITAKKHTSDSWDLLDLNKTYFKQILSWAEMHGVQLIIVTPPAYQSYYQNLDKNQLTEMERFGRSLDSLSQQCRYINLLTSTEFDASDFSDPDHLSQKGSEKFSRLMDGLIGI